MFMLLLLFNRSRASMYAGDVEGGKSCCGVTVTQTVSIRWFIVMIAFVGICCAVVGTVLGAMRSSGREHLTVSLLMIGKIFLTYTYRPLLSSSFFQTNDNKAQQQQEVVALLLCVSNSISPDRQFKNVLASFRSPAPVIRCFELIKMKICSGDR